MTFFEFYKSLISSFDTPVILHIVSMSIPCFFIFFAISFFPCSIPSFLPCSRPSLVPFSPAHVSAACSSRCDLLLAYFLPLPFLVTPPFHIYKCYILIYWLLHIRMIFTCYSYSLCNIFR